MDWLPLIVWLLTTTALPLAMATANTCLTCCQATTGCIYCDDSGDIAADSVQVVISGVTNSVCAGLNCSNLNGTYILTRTSFGVGANCRWFVNVPGTICTHAWTVNAYISATELMVNVVDGFSLTTIVWQSSAAGFRNCLGWSSFSLSFASNANTFCSGTAATVNVTAL